MCKYFFLTQNKLCDFFYMIDIEFSKIQEFMYSILFCNALVFWMVYLNPNLIFTYSIY